MGNELPTLRIYPRELFQHVSRVAYRGTPLYYGRDGMNRYDDPAKNYGWQTSRPEASWPAA